MTCSIQVSPRSLPGGGHVVTARQLLPLPAAEDYLVKRRRKEKAEEELEASARSRNSVTILLEVDAIEPGTELRLNLSQLSAEERTVLEPEIQNNPELGLAEWTGLGLRKAIRWRVDGETYSASGLVKHILSQYVHDVDTLAGPKYWKLPDGRTLSYLASTIDKDLPEGESGV